MAQVKEVMRVAMETMALEVRQVLQVILAVLAQVVPEGPQVI
jgi:hypothetical protein